MGALAWQATILIKMSFCFWGEVARGFARDLSSGVRLSSLSLSWCVYVYVYLDTGAQFLPLQFEFKQRNNNYPVNNIYIMFSRWLSPKVLPI